MKGCSSFLLLYVRLTILAELSFIASGAVACYAIGGISTGAAIHAWVYRQALVDI